MSSSKFDKYQNHQYIWDILPWFVNNASSEQEKSLIQEHINICILCRKELAAQSLLSEQMRASEIDNLMIHTDYVQLQKRIDLAQPNVKRYNLFNSIGRLLTSINPLQWKVGVAMVAVSSVLMWFVFIDQSASLLQKQNNIYRTLSNTSDASANPDFDIKAVFVDSLLENEKMKIINGVGANVVKGPSEHGVYWLKLAEGAANDEIQQSLSELKNSNDVIFVELATNKLKSAG